MIIRSSFQCAAKRPLIKRRPPDPKSLFYARFYHVINAMQVKEESVCDESQNCIYKRKFTAKLDAAGVPGKRKTNVEFKLKSGHVLDIETGLAKLAVALEALGQSLLRNKKRLEQLHDIKSKRRRSLLQEQPQEPKKHLTDPVYSAHEQDVRRLKLTLNNPHVKLQLDVDGARHRPNIVSIQAPSKQLDNRIHDILREPAQGQLSVLASTISNTHVCPTEKTFNIMISRLSRLRLNAAAWIVFQTMLRLQIAPDEYTISSVLNLSIVTGSYYDFRKVLNAARLQRKLQKHSNARPPSGGRSLILLSTIIKGCVKFGHMRRAETYLKLMLAEGKKPNMEVLTCLIRGHTRSKNWNAGIPHYQRLNYMDWDRKTVATLIHFCRACKNSVFEQKVRVMASIKGIEPVGPGDDLAEVPIRWKSKGLDVPDHFKSPNAGDIGAIHARRKWKEKSEDEIVLDDKEGRRPPVYIGTRKQALGKWAYTKRCTA